MKKLFLSAFVLAATVIFLNSCKDDEKVDGGSFTVDGTKYSLKNGYAMYYGEDEIGDEDYANWVVILTSNGLTIDDDGFSGSGDFVYLDMYSLTLGDDKLSAGTYDAFTEGGDILSDGGIMLNYDAEEDDGDEVDLGDVEEATAIVTKNGDRYTIKLTIKRTGETDIVASYSGPIEVLED